MCDGLLASLVGRVLVRISAKALLLTSITLERRVLLHGAVAIGLLKTL